VVDIVLVVELQRSCFFRDAIFPAGYICRIATEEERLIFMSTKTGEMVGPVEKALTEGAVIVFLNGKLRRLEKGHYRIISRNQESV
jgi:hypothetical protein